jgi:hypothetical protein
LENETVSFSNDTARRTGLSPRSIRRGKGNRAVECNANR